MQTRIHHASPEGPGPGVEAFSYVDACLLMTGHFFTVVSLRSFKELKSQVVVS